MHSTMSNTPSTETSNQNPEVVVLFLFFGLTLGGLISYLLPRFRTGMPYTVVVFLLGIIIAIIENFSSGTDTLKLSIEEWLNIPPKIIIFVFLPALLFRDSMQLNPHHVKGSILSAILLAGPGALIGMYLMAALSYVTLPYLWSWNLCCTFGAILCATDPVAVVVLLNRLKASPPLTMLIIGEALLNDGSALVLFNMYYFALKGQTDVLQPGNVIVYFLKVIFVSPIVGALMGLLSVLVIGFANRRLGEEDRMVQMATTLSCAYLSFFVAEYSIGVSGVICCCSSGLGHLHKSRFVLSLMGMPLILDQNAMSSVWGAIEWMGNTLLFLLAGLIIGNRAVIPTRAEDFGYVILMYLLVMIVRVIMVVGFYPILSKRGIKINYREAIFLSFAGLRGGVALALVLLLENSARKGLINATPEDGHRMAFLVGGVTALTLIINAIFAGPLLVHLELVTSKTEDQLIYLQYVRKRLRNKCVLVLSKLVRAQPNIDYFKVQTFCSVLEGIPRPDFERACALPEDFGSPSKHLSLSSLPSDLNTSFTSINFILDTSSLSRLAEETETRGPEAAVISELMHRVRATFLEIVRHIYWEHIREGKIPRDSSAAMALLFSIDTAMDSIRSPGLQDWNQLSVLTDFVPKAQNLFDYFLYNAFRGDRTETAVFILHSYIEAHEEAQLKILYYLGETEHADTPEEALVVRESQSNVSLARGKLSSLPGDIISVVHSKQAARVLLYTQEDMIEDLQSEGILQEKDAKILIRALLDDFAKLRGPSCQLFDQSWLFGDQTSENVSRSRGPKEFIFSPLFENHPEENSESAEGLS